MEYDPEPRIQKKTFIADHSEVSEVEEIRCKYNKK